MAQYSVEAFLRANTSDFTKGFREAERATRGFEKSTAGAGITVGKLVAALGLVALATKGFQMVKNSIQSAFGRIDTMEQFDRTMTAITGNTEEVSKALDKTNSIVKGTGYGLDVAAKSVQNFVTRGVEIDKATGYVEAWGDAVAFYGDGSNEQFSNVTDALAKMTTTGKVHMDQLNRLFDVGIDAVGMYAKATNRDVESVSKDLSAGKISAEDFIDVVTEAMMEGTNGVVQIAGAAKEAGASWGNVFDNMSAAVTRGTMNIIQSIDEMLVNNGLPDMRTMVAGFGSQFEGVLTWIAEQIPIIVEKLMSVKAAIEPWIPMIFAVVGAFGAFIATVAVVNTLWSALVALKKALTITTTASEGASKVTKFLGSSFMGVNIPIIIISAALLGLGVIIYNLWQNNEDFRNNVMTIWASIQSIFQQVFAVVQPLFMNFITILGVAVAAMVPLVAMVVSAIASFLQWAAALLQNNQWIMQLAAVVLMGVAAFKAYALVVGVVTGVVKALTAVYRGIIAVMAVFRASMTTAAVASTIFGTTSTLAFAPISIPLLIFLGVVGAVVAGLVWMYNQFEWFRNMIAPIVDGIKGLWNGFLDILGLGTKEATAEASESINGMAENTGAKTADMSQSAQSNVNDMTAGITGNFDMMSGQSSSIMDGMSGNVLGAFSNMNSGATLDAANMNASVVGDASAMTSGVMGNMSNMAGSATGDVSAMTSGIAGDFSSMTGAITGDTGALTGDVTSDFASMSSGVSADASAMDSAVSSSFDSMSNSLSSGMGNVSRNTGQEMDKTRRKVETSLKAMVSTFKQQVTMMSTVVKQGMMRVTQAVTLGMLKSLATLRKYLRLMVSAARSIRAQMMSAGVYAMSGFQAGLNARAGGVYATARRIANNVASTMRRALQVRSPSRVMMGIGEFVGEGLGIGMESMTHFVERSAATLGEAAIPSLDPDGIARQINGINRQTSAELQHNVVSELSLDQRQPAYVTIRIGNNEFQTFVDDITKSQQRGMHRPKPRGR
ncbi:tape measure protein [Shouchella lonarensis]|uniref:Tape measure domain-containing protein n=1 Tax=Shouchella lonarensis TaxID=1464122 RepID=A0A1G6HPR8_9BACI|nr:tape measure protein [Shouchella lonarensis]SDB96279.1 tape measure domain-containing protein [Shouchella lonarensis]